MQTTVAKPSYPLFFVSGKLACIQTLKKNKITIETPVLLIHVRTVPNHDAIINLFATFIISL